MPIFLLSEKLAFPSPHLADESGLLAVGGDLRLKRLLLAYRMGIFPWYSRGDPILWWSPDPRLVLYPADIQISKRLRRFIRQQPFQLTMDQAFDHVIADCAAVRRRQGVSTWIVKDMVRAYGRLHRSGFAHSVEAWQSGRLAGGLYGVSLGGTFFGESMVSHVSNASKVTLAVLARCLKNNGFDMIDCQVPTDHLKRFGAVEISRGRFLQHLAASLTKPTRRGRWSIDALPPA